MIGPDGIPLPGAAPLPLPIPQPAPQRLPQAFSAAPLGPQQNQARNPRGLSTVAKVIVAILVVGFILGVGSQLFRSFPGSDGFGWEFSDEEFEQDPGFFDDEEFFDEDLDGWDENDEFDGTDEWEDEFPEDEFDDEFDAGFDDGSGDGW
ncbi:hypothetical protein [Leucobacter soli]|uniref:hypothetical protein n=1 Tax=Leucobacter soli TaxID=2812850 RepID=UPI00362251E8